jgi:hypothetical protein
MMSTTVCEEIQKVGFQGQPGSQQKVNHMIGYLTELGFGLCLCPSHDMSENPGIEAALRIYGNASLL